MIESMRMFILRMEMLDSMDGVYEMYENECTDELRDHIYSFADPDSAEPFRSAMHNLGYVNY